MTAPVPENKSVVPPIREVLSRRGRPRFLGLTIDDAIRSFFGGNATFSIIVLVLIMFLLVREGFGFLPMNHFNLTTYRQAGLEYVDLLRQQVDGHKMLSRYLGNIRLQQFKTLVANHKTLEEANVALAPLDHYITQFDATIAGHDDMLTEMVSIASDFKERVKVNEDRITEIEMLKSSGKADKAGAIKLENFDYIKETQPLRDMFPKYQELNAGLAQNLKTIVGEFPALLEPKLAPQVTRFKTWTHDYLATFPMTEREMSQWDPMKPVPFWKSFSSFIFGTRWLTASFWQDWYGIIPLFMGSLTISLISLFIAVPFAISAAIYVNQIATAREQSIIKPYIEFISAIPSIVLGFFGIAVLGNALRALSGWEFLSWVPGFPMSERLNMFTASCLLALMAVPTIFTLAEDALNNVPRSYVEASTALGSTKFQTIIRIMVPAGLSGIISAILLGLGRVIGETMVVLLCAGNRIEIPDFFNFGLGAIFQPAHTMTGIIAQEMGEVVHGSIHYRALFMVGILLFFISLLINYAAQLVVKKFKISIG